jgi:iron complex outermembrane receptor protein
MVLHGEYSQSDNDGGIYKPLYIAPGAAAGLDAAIEKYGLGIFGLGVGGATNAGVALYQQQIGGNPYDVSYNLPNFTHTTIDGVSLNIAYVVSDNLSLKSITSYRHLVDTDQEDLDGSSFGLLATAQQNYQSQITEEFQAIGQALDNKLKYQTGVFYISRNANYISDSTDFLGLASLGAVVNPSYANSEYDTTSEAVYGQAEYALTSNLNVTAGLRWTTESDTLDNSSYSGGTGYPAAGVSCNVPAAYNIGGACHVTEQNSNRNVSYTFGLDWTPITDTLLYARTSRGFKSGGINERVSSSPNSLSKFLPEIVEDYEGGIKTTQLDGRLRIDADIYHSDYSNYQASIIESDAGNLFTVVQNAKAAQINGAEFDVIGVPVNNLTVHFLAAWTDPFYTNFETSNGVTDINQTFRNFLQTPRWTTEISGSYLIPSDFVNTRLTVDYSYRGDADLQPNDAPGVNGPGTAGLPNAYRIQKAFSTVNAELLLHLNKYNTDILVYGKNITNTRYLEGELGLVTAGVGIATGLPGEPANWGITLTKYFR